MEHIKAVFLDIDNTILNFDAYVKDAMKVGFQKFDLGEFTEKNYLEYEEENHKVWKELEEGRITFAYLKKIRFQRYFQKYGIQFNGEQFEDFFREYLWNSAISEDGIEDLLAYLCQKYLLYTASNGPYDQQVHRIELAGYSKYFQDHFISEEIGLSKPAIGFFQSAIDRMKKKGNIVKPMEIVMIGDSISSDITGGYYAGMHTIWYNRESISNEGKITPDFEVNHLSQIKAIL